MAINKVSIKFKPGAYAAYRSMNNKIHFALAEYIDNALQSYITHKKSITEIEGQDFQFNINLDIKPDEDKITIRDNAAGIDKNNFLRAFEPANIPLDNSGLSEFGMGMKIASIWLANIYIVRSSYLGEHVQRIVEFDLKKVIKEEKEDLSVNEKHSPLNDHFTEITLKGLSSNAPTRHNFNKIKSHLTSIYRKFLRSGELNLQFNGEKLEYHEPKILIAPYYKDGLEKIEWKEDIEFDAGDYSIKGFIGLLEEMSNVNSGLSLFRRGRVIEGSHDEKYHPKVICGQPGSPRDKRLFGELEITGFEVSFDKGSFRDTKKLDTLLATIKDQLSLSKFDLLKQGDKYRKNITDNETLKEKISNNLSSEKKKKKSRERIENALFQIEKEESNKKVEKSQNSDIREDFKKSLLSTIEEEYEFSSTKYRINLHIVDDPSNSDLYAFKTTSESTSQIIHLEATLNLNHPFFTNYKSFNNAESFEPVFEIIKSLILAEVISRSQGTKFSNNIRLNLNKLLFN